jgi:putative transposase
MTYWRLHYHLIWATHDRQPLLTPAREKVFYKILHDKAKDFDLKIHAIGCVDDHVHVALSIPPRISIAECVKHLKGTSSHAINHSPDNCEQFKWQEGYGALSLGDQLLSTVVAYVLNQKQHHQDRSIVSLFERLDE